MPSIKKISPTYEGTTAKMIAKGMKQYSIIPIKSYIIERFEFWVDKDGNNFILEVMKNGSVNYYKEIDI